MGVGGSEGHACAVTTACPSKGLRRPSRKGLVQDRSAAWRPPGDSTPGAHQALGPRVAKRISAMTSSAETSGDGPLPPPHHAGRLGRSDTGLGYFWKSQQIH